MRNPTYIALLSLDMICGWASATLAQDLPIQLPPHWQPVPIKRGRPIPANLAGVTRAIDLDRVAEHYESAGRGIVIAVIGSGMQTSNVLSTKVVKLQDFERSTFPGHGKPDEHGSGTFFAGILASEGVTRGVTPAVRILPIPIVRGDGLWKIEDLAAALKLLVDRKLRAGNVSIVCLALSDQGHYRQTSDAARRYGDRFSEVRKHIVSLQNRDVLVLAPTGENRNAYEEEGVAFPAVIPEVIRVGAFFDASGGSVTFDNSEFPCVAGQQVPFTQWSSDTILGPAGPTISTGTGTEQATMLPGASFSATAVAAGVCALVQSNHLRARDRLPSAADVRRWLMHASVKSDDRPDENSKEETSGFVRLNALLTLRALERDLNGQDVATTVPKSVRTPLSSDMREVISLIGVDRIRELSLTVNGEKLKRKIDGTGQCVAIVSTGINAAHVDFQGRDRIVSPISFVGGDATKDDNGVGTLVAGIISANGKHVGIAPGAKIVPVQAFSRDGGTTNETLLKAVAWIAKESPRLGITAVLFDAGGRKVERVDQALETNIERELAAQLRVLRERGIPVIVPAGNASNDEESLRGMSFPAILPQVISVAAYEAKKVRPQENLAQQQQFESKSEFAFAPYSYRLGRDKATLGTTIVAPGGPIVSTGIDHVEGSATMRGTSIAAAVTTGAILLLQDYHKLSEKESSDVDHLVECLQEGGWFLFDPVSETELFRLDTFNALRVCQRKNRSSLPGSPSKKP